jgi:hypothetical protein
MKKMIAFNKFSGTPYELRFILGSWWIVQQDGNVSEVVDGEVGFGLLKLCLKGEELRMKDLALLMGCSMNERKYGLGEVLKARLAELRKLGVKFKRDSQNLRLRVELDVTIDMENPGRYTVSCFRAADDLLLFSIEDCEDRLEALEFLRCYIDFFTHRGVSVDAFLD